MKFPSDLLTFAMAVRDAGGRALVVGGWVRDRLWGLQPKETDDLDVEVFGLAPDVLRGLVEALGTVNTVGSQFTVYKVGRMDVSLPRRESKTGTGHTGFTVEGDPTMTVREAARRRDFTMNAMAMDPLTGVLEDPFGGRTDLEARVLRVVDPVTFVDDSLRVLRAMQFVARFGLTVDPASLALMATVPLDDLPAERVWGEVEKLLMKGTQPSLGWQFALEAGVVGRLWPELQALVGCPQDPVHHPEGDVWTHTLMVVDAACQQCDGLDRGPALAVMLGALCHDLGKPATTKMVDGRLRALGHEAAGVPVAASLLDRLNVHTVDGFDVRGAVLALTNEHMKVYAFGQADDSAYRRLARRVSLDLLVRLGYADSRGHGGAKDVTPVDAFLARVVALGVRHQPPAPLVMGRHLMALGMAPGKAMGAALAVLYERQLDGQFQTVEDGLVLAKTLM